jgi:asparagine synthetase A
MNNSHSSLPQDVEEPSSSSSSHTRPPLTQQQQQRSSKKMMITRQLTLSDELVTLLDMITEKEREVQLAGERKLVIKNYIKGKLADFQHKYGRNPTLEEKEAMAELYLQHQEVTVTPHF